jgi:hypothetical protein
VLDVESIVQMRSASTAWPSRLLAAAIALVLVVAYVIGAYAHAVGHQAPLAGHATSLSDAGGHADHAAALAVAAGHDQAHGHPDSGHDDDRKGHTLDCCDTICHGGQAILAEDAVIPASLMAVPSIEPAATLHGADPGGFDRPPKPFRSA